MQLPESLRQEWPRTVTYRERLIPDENGHPTVIEVEIPRTRQEAFDLLEKLQALAATDPQSWKLLMRQYMAADWYFLALNLSGAQRYDAWHKRPEIDCDFQFAYARARQFDSHGVVDYTARGHWKSTWTTHVGVINRILNDPDATILIASKDIPASEKHTLRNKQELDSNEILKAVWSDTFWANETERQERGKIAERPQWSAAAMTVKGRTIVSTSPTLSCCGIMQIPTGGRFSVIVLDDVEDDDTTITEEARAKLKDRCDNILNTAGRGVEIWVNATIHHPAGLVTHMINGGRWRSRCIPEQVITEEAPDIAALYDAHGGIDAGNNKPMAPAVRNQKLIGAPIYLHPLEVAQKMLRSPLTYYSQNMGDPLGGSHFRFDLSKIRRFNQQPREWANGKNVYILVDGARGDSPDANPSCVLVVGLGADESVSWLDGVRRIMTPDELDQEVFRLYTDWMFLCREVCELRVEIYGQATWDLNFAKFFEKRGLSPHIVTCGRPVRNRIREATAIGPFINASRWLWPQGGIWTEDERGMSFDLCQTFIDLELKNFPLPTTDDILAAWALLGEPENPKRGIGPLRFPRPWEDDEGPGQWGRDPIEEMTSSALWRSGLN